MIPHKTYIPHIPALVYLVCFYRQSILPSDHFNGIIFPQFSALHHLIFNFYNTNLNLNRMCYSIFQIFLLIFNKKKNTSIWYLYSQQFFNTCYLFLKKNGANVSDTQYLHSNRWWHHTIWRWRKYIPCIWELNNDHWVYTLILSTAHDTNSSFIFSHISCMHHYYLNNYDLGKLS